jgi:Putative zinc-finger
MNHEPDNLETLSRFLLGELSPEEEERMEIRLLDDAGLQELVEAAEFELIDDYVHGALTGADAARFEAHFLNSPARRRKLELARLFPGLAGQPDHHTANGKTSDNVTPLNRRRTPIPSFIRQATRRPAFRIAAGLLVTLGLAAVLWQVVWPAWQLRQGMASLNDAYRKGRPVEARLSGFDHARWEKDRGPGDDRTDLLLRDRGSLTLLDLARARRQLPAPAGIQTRHRTVRKIASIRSQQPAHP